MDTRSDQGSTHDPISAAAATAALAAVADSREAARRAARPPLGFLGGLSVCVAVLVAVSGLGPGWEVLKLVLFCLVVVAEIALVVWRRSSRRVSPSRFAIFRDWRPNRIAMIVVFVVLLAIVIATGFDSIRTAVPWWGYLLAAVVVGSSVFALTNWTWGRWVKEASTSA